MGKDARKRINASIILISCFLGFQQWCHAEPSEDHRNLSAAAHWAVITSNIELLKALLQAGLHISEPIDSEFESTLLHEAAIVGTERMVQFIIDNGASLETLDHSRCRPIDHAYEAGRTNICLLLSKTVTRNDYADGFPVEMLEVAYGLDSLTNKVWVLVNNREPSVEMLKLLRESTWPNATAFPVSNVIENIDGTLRIKESTAIDRSAYYSAIEIEKANNDEYICRMNLFHGGNLSTLREDRLLRRYGYWVKHRVPLSER